MNIQNNWRMKKLFTFLVYTVFLVSLFTGCKKNKGNPPDLPPEESMAIDFSNFDSGKSDVIQLPKGVEDSNWSFVTDRANEWKYVTDNILAVPFTSYPLVSDHTPSYIEDKTWQWSFNFTVLSETYKARLTGQIRTSDVLWKMYIAKEGTGGFSEFVWFEGSSKIDGTGGQWTYNHSSLLQELVLQIDWTRTGATMGTVKYTYVRTLNDSRSPDPFKSSYILYGKMTVTYDSYYTIHYYDGSGFSDVNVEWNSTSRIGHVKCPAFFADSNWHCWDANYGNIKCL